MKSLSAAVNCRSRRNSPQWTVFLYSIFLLCLLPGAAQAGNVTLEWDPGASTEAVSGYKVYYGSSSGSYENVLNIGNHTSCEISGLTEGKRYYFSATTYDAEGNESAKSGEISHIAGSAQKSPEVKKRIAAVNTIVTALLLKEN